VAPNLDARLEKLGGIRFVIVESVMNEQGMLEVEPWIDIVDKIKV
jgi:hypothetical protein